MKSKVYAIAMILISLVTVVSFIGWFLLEPAPYIMQGQVEARSYKAACKLPGRVDSLAVRRGQVVHQGMFLYKISSPEIYAKLTQAEAVKTAAGAMQTKVDKGARKQIIQQAYELWQKAIVGYELSQKTYERVKALYDSGVVPVQKLDEASAAMRSIKTSVEAARAGYDMALEGAQQEDKTAAAAMVTQAGGAVSEVESYIADSRQFSPIDGEVSSVISENGELVGTGYPVVTIIDLKDVWVVFNLKETMLPKIKMGTRFEAYFPALDRTAELEVSYIAPVASYATWAATRTSGEFDIRTFEVHARPISTVTDIRPGMSATVDYDKL